MSELVFIETKVRMPLMDLPVRSVLVPVANHFILLSPGSKVNPEQYRSEWKVSDIVAPNSFHTAGILKAKAHFPEATLWGYEGAQSSMAKIPWQKILGKDNWPYQDVLTVVSVDGMPKVNESLFIHRPSKSLIVTDFCFNVTGVEGLGATLIFKLFGTYNRLGMSRFFAGFIKDKAAFKHSMKTLMAHDFENIIVSHGQNVYGSAKERLQQCLAERSLV